MSRASTRIVSASLAAAIVASILATLHAAESNSDAFLPPIPVPAENPITEQKRILGKILFWDEQLSSDNNIACGTCHIPSAGGSDPRSGIHSGYDKIFGNADDVVGSIGVIARDETGSPVEHETFGFDAQVTARSAPTNIGVMYAPELFWDGRARSQFIDPENSAVAIDSNGALENQAVETILSSAEMSRQGRSWADVRIKLESITPLALATNIPLDIQATLENVTTYPSLFDAAFGDSSITAARIAMALATYQRTLLPNQTPWDKYMAGDDDAMNSEQIAGWKQFQANFCTECHTPPLFTDNGFYNIGLRPSIEDLGRQIVTGEATDRGRFKTPTLRNVGLRRNLGHVGWLEDTRDTVDYYNTGSTPSVSFHEQFFADQSRTPLSDLQYSVIQIAPFESDIQNEVIEFLNTGLTDPRVATETYPFDRPTLRSEI